MLHSPSERLRDPAATTAPSYERCRNQGSVFTKVSVDEPHICSDSPSSPPSPQVSRLSDTQAESDGVTGWLVILGVGVVCNKKKKKRCKTLKRIDGWWKWVRHTALWSVARQAISRTSYLVMEGRFSAHGVLHWIQFIQLCFYFYASSDLEQTRSVIRWLQAALHGLLYNYYNFKINSNEVKQDLG